MTIYPEHETRAAQKSGRTEAEQVSLDNRTGYIVGTRTCPLRHTCWSDPNGAWECCHDPDLSMEPQS